MVPQISLQDVELQLKRYRHRTGTLKETVLGWLSGRAQDEGPATFAALEDINLSISSGERVGIIGRNGAGKSTLLRVIAGIYRPSRGRVSIHGFLVPLLQAEVGFCNELTARENILQAGAILGIPCNTMKAHIDDILEFAELTDFAETPTKYFSRGMAMRLAFTTATTADADILILDEALGGGDLGFREKAQQRLEDMIARTKIVIMASHSMESVQRLCTRAVWIERGRIHADGPPKEVIERYRQIVLQSAPQRKCA